MYILYKMLSAFGALSLLAIIVCVVIFLIYKAEKNATGIKAVKKFLIIAFVTFLVSIISEAWILGSDPSTRKQSAAESAAREKEEATEKKQAAAESAARDKAEAAEKDEVARNAPSNKDCYDAWDGSVSNMVKQVKEQLRDPDSFQHVSTGVEKTGLFRTVVMTYRARNGFGGMNEDTVYGQINNETCDVKVGPIG